MQLYGDWILLELKMSRHYYIGWDQSGENLNSYLQSSVTSSDILSDVTLISDDNVQVPTHRVILAAASEVFKDILQNVSEEKHPCIILHGVSSNQLQTLLQYIYTGEVSIDDDDLADFNNLGSHFNIKSLDEYEELTVGNNEVDRKYEPKVKIEEDETEDCDTKVPKFQIDSQVNMSFIGLSALKVVFKFTTLFIMGNGFLFVVEVDMANILAFGDNSLLR